MRTKTVCVVESDLADLGCGFSLLSSGGGERNDWSYISMRCFHVMLVVGLTTWRTVDRRHVSR
jgi:hypothetical protein